MTTFLSNSYKDDLKFIKAVLNATYQYWDGYYIPDNESEWPEDRLVEEIYQELKSTLF